MVGRKLFQAEGMNLCKSTGEHLVRSLLKLGAGKTKGDSKGEKGLYCVGKARKCQARDSAFDLALDEGEPLRAFEQ